MDIINAIDKYLDMQKSSADMLDPYMRGMYNGIEFVRAMITKDEPVFMEKDGSLDKEAMDRHPERYI